MHGIIANHGGAIFVHSKPRKGTTFNVYLPRTDTPPMLKNLNTDPIPGGSERILFVDDEEPLTKYGERILTRFGYDVITTTSSVLALETISHRPATL